MNNPLTRRFWIASLCAAATAAGCGAGVAEGGATSTATGSSSTTTPTAATSTGQPVDSQPNWANPTGGDPVPDLATAQQEVGARIPAPEGLGTATTIIVAPNAPVRVATFVFQTTAYGQVDVTEGPSQFDDSSWTAYLNASVQANSDPNAYGTAAIVTVQNQFSGLQTVSGDASWSTVDWLEPGSGIEFIVRGPSLTAAQSIAIANGLA